MSKVFDHMLQFRDDPKAFDKEAERIIEETIQTYPPERQAALRQFAWTIRAPLSPLKGIQRYNKVVEQFWVGFVRFQRAMNGEQPNKE